MLKDISCGALRSQDIGKSLTLAGWVHRRRDHGNLIFIDLRDRGGLVQVVFNPELAEKAHEIAQQLRNEWVIQVSGEVSARPEGTVNEDMLSGAIEVYASELTVLNRSLTPPFYVNEDTTVDENVRLKYRYVDLRREVMKNTMIVRHKVVKYIRDFLDSQGFLEIETPILIKSTPEGARDHIVPSRLYPGNFYALPQSPQQLKQLLMVAGFEKYFQIARCFRDEDSRADRQPEFTQLDLEMSFVTQEDVLSLTEDLFSGLLETLFPDKKFMKPFPRLSYEQSMEDYGTDKPDLRFEMKMSDLGNSAKKTEFNVFHNVLDNQGIVKGFAAPGCGEFTRGQIDELTEFVKDASSETSDVQTYLFVKDNISKYHLNIDIDSKILKNKLIEVNTTLKFKDKEPNEKKSHFEMTYASIVKIDEEVKKEDLKKILLCDVQNKIYPNLEKIFINLLENSGFPGIKFDKKIDFNKLYNEKIS